MIWRAMRLKKGFKVSALLAGAVPALVALTAVSTIAASSPSPSASAVALPGDPSKGQALYAANCASCHGVSLTGNIGPALNPIYKLPDVANPLDPTFLIDIITNGRVHKPGDPGSVNMPAKGGNSNLTDQDIKDIVSYIIQQNQAGSPPLSPNELAKRTIFWVGVAIVGMVFITLLLSQYNMRWIARRAAARRK
ncbi:MAG TPA: cytochrome c [Candidatus Dormibacteraeota bacterium]|jgi:mono/diheme cytochrome c family protein